MKEENKNQNSSQNNSPDSSQNNSPNSNQNSSQNSSQLQEMQKILRILSGSENLYVMMSVCTRMPFVLCDEETFDDEILMFANVEDAQAEGKRLAESMIPVNIAKLENKQLLGFYSGLYTMGVNCIVLNRNKDQEMRIQLEDLVKRPDMTKLEEGKVWVENPQLHLTALYFMQEVRRQKQPKLTEELKELQEEVLVSYGRGRYILAIQNDKGLPVLKQKNGDTYQPIFTDIVEFRKFNKEGNFRTAVIQAQKVPEILAPEVKGVVVNPFGVNLQIPIVRKKESEKKESE